MEAKLIRWGKIGAFKDVRKYIRECPSLEANLAQAVAGEVQYKSKIKLHGSNGAVQCHTDGTVIAQSREQLLINGADNSGFAKWVESTQEHWQRHKGLCIFGEWAGHNIQSGTALNQIKKKFFAVFAILHMESGIFITEPADIQRLLGDIPDVYVLPWSGHTINIDWNKTAEELTPLTEVINSAVLEVEKVDPWVQNTFNITGTGEGLVYYPMPAVEKHDLSLFFSLTFKAKGLEHRVVKSKTATTVEPEVAASIDEFVELVATEPRMAQGAYIVSPEFDKKLTGAFVSWLLADIENETKSELEASGLTWADVQKPLAAKARKWYLSKS